MQNNLPYLNQERLNIIFDHVYDIAGMNDSDQNFKEEKLRDLLETLKSMQRFNFNHRPDDTRILFGLFEGIISFERNSEGTTWWLSLILAIKELYGFSDMKLVSVIKQSTMRK